MTFGLTPLGFNKKRLADIKQDLENAFIAEFGDINIDPQSVFGQEIGTLAKDFADVWENLEDVYYSQYPNSAEGIALDNVVALNGITRLPAQRTRVTAIITGNEATLIPSGSLARIPNTNNTFYNPTDAIITRNNAYRVSVEVSALAAQVYSMIISNSVYSFSLPIIIFDAPFVTGNIITFSINGVALTPVPFNVDNDTTLADIATEIATAAQVLSATPVITDTINIVPNLGFNAVVTNINITGGASQPNYAITYAVPVSAAQITQYLVAAINAASGDYSAADLTGTFSVTADSVSQPFVASVQSNLNIFSQSTPVIFLSQDFGPIAAPANSLTQILTPIAGWTSINNPTAGVLGRFVETDAELRLRRIRSIRLAGNATVEAIRARILQNVPGVTSALVFENVNMIQDPIQIVFAQNLVTGNQITITMNSRVLATIPWSTSNAFTLNQIALLLQAQPEIDTATVTGANTIEITMNIFQEVEIEDIVITGGASQSNYSIKGGRPPKSFELVVEGGSDEDIANEIWLSKPAGIQTYGNTSFTITDSMGFQHVIYFSRPTPIYIWVQIVLSLYSEETFPVNGLQAVADAILAYGNSLGVGLDVLFQRVLCAIFAVPGVAGGTMLIAATNSPTDTPLYSTNDIVIDENEISVWDLTRIFVSV